MPMRAQYKKELKDALSSLVLMCRYIQAAVESAANALLNRDELIAQEVFESVMEMGEMGAEVESSCFRLLLMEHPVANDFYEVTTALKIASELDRIGGQALEIAEIAIQLCEGNYPEKPDLLSQLCLVAAQMAKDAIQSYINRDMELSKPLASMGEKAHSLYEGVLNSAKDRALGSQHAILAVMAAKCLIKLSDHCLDVGKWAEYAITGRHPRKEAAK